MKLIAALTLCFALAISAACGDDDGGDARRGPHVRGEIVSYLSFVQGERDGAMRVDGELEPDTVYQRAVATFNDETSVFRREQGTEIPASTDDLALGQLVEVTLTGPISESDPPFGRASKIVILEEPDGVPVEETQTPAGGN